MRRIRKFFTTGAVLVASLVFVAYLEAGQIAVTPEDEEILIEDGAEKIFTFLPISINKSKPKSTILVMEGHVRSSNVSGYSATMKLEVNGVTIEGPRLVNKPLETEYGTKGLIQAWYHPSSKRWTLVYAHNFLAPDRNETYRAKGGNTCRFEFDITDLVSDKKMNEIVIYNVRGEHQMLVRNLAIRYDGELKEVAKSELPIKSEFLKN